MAIMDELQNQQRRAQTTGVSVDKYGIPLENRDGPAPDGSQKNPLNSELGRNVTNTLNALPGAAAVPGLAARAASAASTAIGGAAPATTLAGRAAGAVAPYAPVAVGGATIYAGANPGTSKASPTVPAASPLATPAAASSGLPSGSEYNYRDNAIAGPNPTASVSAPTPAPTATTNNVTRNGDSYSGANVAGDISINGQAPGGGFMVTPGQRSLAAAAYQPSVSSVDAPTITNSTNDWAARNNLRNAEVSASSITNQGRFSGLRRGEVSPAVAAYQDAVRADLAAQGMQGSVANNAMTQNANLQREGMQQAGLNQRYMVDAAMRGNDQLLRQQDQALRKNEFDAKQYTQGFADRALAQQEALYNSLQGEQDPIKRKSIMDSLMAMHGKANQADPYLVVPGGQHVDPISGKAYNTPSSVFNRQTGQWVTQPQAGGNSPPQAAIAALKANPKLAADFDAKFGTGASQSYLSK